MSTKKSSNKLGKGAAPKGADPAAAAQKIIANAKQNIPAPQRAMFDKIILGGMRIMFDPASKQMTDEVLEKEGPLANRLIEGAITLMYMLWQKSNRTLPPQLIVPATLVLTCEGFRYVADSKDPEATGAVLGEAIAGAVQGVMDRFGATQDKLPALLKGQNGATAGAQPEQGGLLAAATGAKA